MRNWLTKLQPSPWLLRKLLMLAILVGVGVTAFFWGRRQHADAQSSGLPIDPKAGDVLISTTADPGHHAFKTFSTMTTSRIVINGKEYSRWEDVPVASRALFKTACGRWRRRF